MDFIALIGISVILFYVFNEVLKYNSLDPMEFSIVYIVYIIFVFLAFFLPKNGFL